MTYIIYRIKNLINGKSYVGLSTQYKRRWKSHLQAAFIFDGQSPLNKAMRKYGQNNFSFEIINECESIEQMKQLETYFILIYQSHVSGWGYNQTWGGDFNNGFLGRKHTPEELKKMSESQMGKPKPGTSIALKGISITDEHKKHISESLVGRKLNEDHKTSLKEAWKNRINKTPWNKGKKTIKFPIVFKKICEWCKSDFETNWKPKKTCSSKCAGKLSRYNAAKNAAKEDVKDISGKS